MYENIYAAEKGETVSLEKYFMVPVKEGGVKFLALSQDELQLIVGVTNGLLLVYHVSEIVKNVNRPGQPPPRKQQIRFFPESPTPHIVGRCTPESILALLKAWRPGIKQLSAQESDDSRYHGASSLEVWTWTTILLGAFHIYLGA